MERTISFMEIKPSEDIKWLDGVKVEELHAMDNG
jgi:hypothetical protein